ncbi:hypothetical protein C2I33_21610 [Ralstonia solanacearum]|nr:hypothetical protein C2I33_21610 [Ralstonia solanacearum]
MIGSRARSGCSSASGRISRTAMCRRSGSCGSLPSGKAGPPPRCRSCSPARSASTTTASSRRRRGSSRAGASRRRRRCGSTTRSMNRKANCASTGMRSKRCSIPPTCARCSRSTSRCWSGLRAMPRHGHCRSTSSCRAPARRRRARRSMPPPRHARRRTTPCTTTRPVDPALVGRLRQHFEQTLGRPIAARQRFFEAGASSLDLVRWHVGLRQTGYASLAITDLFTHASPHAQAAHWAARPHRRTRTTPPGARCSTSARRSCSAGWERRHEALSAVLVLLRAPGHGQRADHAGRRRLLPARGRRPRAVELAVARDAAVGRQVPVGTVVRAPCAAAARQPLSGQPRAAATGHGGRDRGHRLSVADACGGRDRGIADAAVAAVLQPRHLRERHRDLHDRRAQPPARQRRAGRRQLSRDSARLVRVLDDRRARRLAPWLRGYRRAVAVVADSAAAGPPADAGRARRLGAPAARLAQSARDRTRARADGALPHCDARADGVADRAARRRRAQPKRAR